MIKIGLLACLMLLPALSFAGPTLIVMRHGQADHNIRRVGNSNPQHPDYFESHLTEVGKVQVKASAERLRALGISPARLKRVIVSPLPRTRETAQILVDEGLIRAEDIQYDDRVIEAQVGDLESKSYHLLPPLHQANRVREYRGENIYHIRQRLSQFLAELTEHEDDGAILIISHGTPARELVRLVSGEGPELSTAEFHIVDLEATGPIPQRL